MKIIDFGLSDFIRPGITSTQGSSKCKGLLFYKYVIIHWNKWNKFKMCSKAWCFPPFTDERLNDIVGSAYYVAPEVLHRSYSTEADMWSIGVITYILLCGSRPFWARTESGIFRSVLRADPNFDDTPWQSVSPEAKDFVKRLLNKDYRKRMTAAQALCKCSHLHFFFHFLVAAYQLYSTFIHTSLTVVFLRVVCMLQLTPGCEMSADKYLLIC